jgi:DNA polymerase V
VAVGIAPTKVLAKIANRIAKREPGRRGVFDLGALDHPDPWLEAIAIEDVWGIGRRLSRWCRLRGITDARALRDMPSGELRRRCGVVGLRLQQELRGHACLPLTGAAPARQETCVSRSFSVPVTSPGALREAVATYLCRAAEKLRRQRQRAGAVTVFVRSSPFDGTRLYSNAATATLPLPSNDTAVLLAAALPLVDRLFRPAKPLRKAGVLLQDLQPLERLQHHLLVPLPEAEQRRREALMATVDALNHRFGRGTVRWAACGLRPAWRMRRSRLSRAATTRLGDVPVVRA